MEPFSISQYVWVMSIRPRYKAVIYPNNLQWSVPVKKYKSHDDQCYLNTHRHAQYLLKLHRCINAEKYSNLTVLKNIFDMN